ncbi:hypothetical protein PIB30_042887 [Stylosanthes scabra]|uniref:Uncharacterized protein n=1 Tax=Stylosanthes scabra TaxID=79078 RepID=A0ABU6RFZ2_9FABA|nr:hypothetical protein [Stylosanthes scabra]
MNLGVEFTPFSPHKQDQEFRRAPISDSEYTNVILDGLSDEYHPFITSVNNRETPLSIPDLEALLMTEEKLLERLKKPDTSMVQVNVTQSSNTNSNNRNKNSDNQ